MKWHEIIHHRALLPFQRLLITSGRLYTSSRGTVVLMNVVRSSISSGSIYDHIRPSEPLATVIFERGIYQSSFERTKNVVSS